MLTNLLNAIKKASKTPGRSIDSGDYHGTTHFHYNLSNPQKREILKAFVKENKDISVRELVELLNKLFTGKSYEEKCMAGMLLGYLPKNRREINPKLLDSWLEGLVGWAEIDSLCQSNFTAKELLDNWAAWERVLKEFSDSKFISKRRASLVLLTKAVGQSNDKRLSGIAFENIKKLSLEKDILITKAISWLLRSMIKFHKQEVIDYLERNKDTLPKIAIRETQIKLKFGIKNYKVKINR